MTIQVERYLIDPNSTIQSAIEKLTRTGTQILLVCNRDRTLLGTVTDGDLRRAMLARVAVTEPIRRIMQARPLVAGEDWSPQQATSLMRSNLIHRLPILDSCGRVTGVFTEGSLISDESLPNTAVLMVGGAGSRLGELTNNCPKPMLKIGGKPILQTAIETLRDAGISKFVLAVHHLAHHICDHFHDGEAMGVQITYCVEKQPLGTAGALRMMELPSSDAILVMNGDILTRVNFGHLLRFHAQNEAAATMCVTDFTQEVPFGVVDLDGITIKRIREKPTNAFFVNSGIYVLDPKALQCIPPEGPFDMPSLFDLLRQQRKKTVAFPIREYWADVGHPDDFQRVEQEYCAQFDS